MALAWTARLVIGLIFFQTPIFGINASTQTAQLQWNEDEAQYKKYLERPQESIVATIGEKSWISKQDLDNWQAAFGCYPDPLNGRRVAWIRLIEYGVMEETLRRYGNYTHLTKERLMNEERRIDESTRAPDILSCIKNHFGPRRSDYWRVYIRPLLVQYESGQFFQNSPVVQGKTFALRDRAKEMIKKTPDLKKISKMLTADTSTAAFSYTERTLSLVEPERKKRPRNLESEWSPFEAEFIKQNLENLSNGEFKKEIVEDDSGFTFIRLIKKKRTKYTYESLVVFRSAEEFTNKMEKIPVHLITIEPEHKNWLMGVKNATLIHVDWK